MQEKEGRMTMSELRAQIINLLQDAWELGYECGAKDISSARTVTLDAMTDTELAERGLVRLPVDADGEVIHIGDRVENNERVVRIVLTDGSWEPSVYVEKRPNVLCEYFCNEISHHHEPTVEDVLREFAYGLGVSVADSYVAAAATKLRLAGENA